MHSFLVNYLSVYIFNILKYLYYADENIHFKKSKIYGSTSIQNNQHKI